MPEDHERVSLLQHRLSIDTVRRQSRRQALKRDLHAERLPDIFLHQRLPEASWVTAAMPKTPSHPFPGLQWSEVELLPAIVCSLLLFAAGVLCSAGGIGGGGVYVTVLMVAGQLSPHDAVPLSKAIVFFGSLSSLVLNVRKSMVKPQGGQVKTLIDYNICRLVVPGALVGTLFGVFLNSLLAPWLIVLLLCLILITMTVMSTRKLIEQWRGEQAEELAVKKLGKEQAEEINQRAIGDDQLPSLLVPSPQSTSSKVEDTSPAKIRGVLLQGEGVAWFLLLVFIICCGTFRAHAMTCYEDIQSDPRNAYGRDLCARPIMKAVIGSRLVRWMEAKALSDIILYGVLSLPISICIMLLTGYTRKLVASEGWTLQQAGAYMGMSFFTGCFAGLVGIGGGLVFSPFMLWMGVEPSIAVATSSTCVIFTSSSTTFQYLLTDRIILSLTLIYGIVNLVASYVGTSLVHALQDRFHAKPSFITAIVCLGVFASVILSVYKLVTMGVVE